MTENNIQEQIALLNRKIDQVLENIEQQKRSREEFDDLIADLSIVGKDAFRQSVDLLDKSQVELDHCGLSCILIKILQNIDTFHEMLDMMESARDFMKDVSPILHQIGLDTVHKMNELDRKGYFEYGHQMKIFLDKFIQAFTIDDLLRLQDNLTNLTGIIRNLTDPDLVRSLNNISRVIGTIKMDDKIDDKSLWKLFLELRSPEVRKSLSYSLRMLKAMHGTEFPTNNINAGEPD